MSFAPHPSRYSRELLPDIIRWTQGFSPLIDPLAGIGSLKVPGLIYGEIEPEWAIQCPGPTIIADAVRLPFRDGTFAAAVTSPCLTLNQRVLKADLSWVPSGDVRPGDQLVAFDEYGHGVKANGSTYRRKWRIATVLESIPAKKKCVRVHLANGESVDCTYDHPWLATRSRAAAVWVPASELLRFKDRPSSVLKQLDPWTQNSSYDAGWLAGMFDGEGSLSFGLHGTPKLMICQVEGPIADQVARRLKGLGFDPSTLLRTGVSENHQPMVNIYIRGGFPEVLRALGTLRPGRLISKLEQLTLASRTIQPNPVQVESVEPLGVRDIQGITTSTGTYIGEGYLHHNTYGNRMADHHVATDASIRTTYRHKLDRSLHPSNTGQMQWGSAYRAAHRAIWLEAHRVLKTRGRFILNCSDHIRKGAIQPVTDWHINVLCAYGFKVVDEVKIHTPRNRFGANATLRVSHESLFLLEKAE